MPGIEIPAIWNSTPALIGVDMGFAIWATIVGIMCYLLTQFGFFRGFAWV